MQHRHADIGRLPADRVSGISARSASSFERRDAFGKSLVRLPQTIVAEPGHARHSLRACFDETQRLLEEPRPRNARAGGDQQHPAGGSARSSTTSDGQTTSEKSCAGCFRTGPEHRGGMKPSHLALGLLLRALAWSPTRLRYANQGATGDRLMRSHDIRNCSQGRAALMADSVKVGAVTARPRRYYRCGQRARTGHGVGRSREPRRRDAAFG